MTTACSCSSVTGKSPVEAPDYLASLTASLRWGFECSQEADLYLPINPSQTLQDCKYSHCPDSEEVHAQEQSHLFNSKKVVSPFPACSRVPGVPSPETPDFLCGLFQLWSQAKERWGGRERDGEREGERKSSCSLHHYSTRLMHFMPQKFYLTR